MRGTTWYTDESAKQMHDILTQELKRIIARMCPGYELSHTGIRRNEQTEEVLLQLHLNPLGRVRVVPDGESVVPTIRIPF